MQICFIQQNFLSLQLIFTRIFTGNLTELVLDVLDAHDETYLIEYIIAKETWAVKKGLSILPVNLYIDTHKMDLQFLQISLADLGLNWAYVYYIISLHLQLVMN